MSESMDQHTTPKVIRTLQVMAITMIITLAMVLFIATRWWFFPVTVLDGSDWKLHVETPVVAPGDEMVLTARACKRVAAVATLSRQIVDTVEWALPDQQTSFPVGCGVHTLTQFVPRVLPNGRYHLVIMVTYQVNPLRNVSYRFESDQFEVRRHE